MKKLHFLSAMLLMLLASFSLASCSDDDDEGGGNILANTRWECIRTFSDATWTQRLHFYKDGTAVIEDEIRNLSGQLIDTPTNSPYTYNVSGSQVVLYPQQIDMAILEGRIIEGIKLVITNTTNPNAEITFYKITK